MCGLYGWSMKKDKVPGHVRGILAATLSRLNDDRGGDSWGICGMDSTQEEGFKITRGLGDLYLSASEVAVYEQMYAHTRFATTGEKTVTNAHPFVIGDIVGAHNGMIYNHKEIADKYNRDFKVDSMHIFANIAEGKSLKELEGYGAIEWINKKEPNRIYLTKLYGGDLSVYYIGDIKSPDAVVWSSDKDHIEEAFLVAGLTQYGAYEINQNRVYVVYDGDIYKTERKLKLQHKPRVSTRPIYISSYTGYYGSEYSSGYFARLRETAEKEEKKQEKEDKEDREMAELDAYYAEKGTDEDTRWIRNMLEEEKKERQALDVAMRDGFGDAWNEYCLNADGDDSETDGWKKE